MEGWWEKHDRWRVRSRGWESEGGEPTARAGTRLQRGLLFILWINSHREGKNRLTV